MVNKIYLTGKLKNGIFILSDNKDHFLCLFKGTLLGFSSVLIQTKWVSD